MIAKRLWWEVVALKAVPSLKKKDSIEYVRICMYPLWQNRLSYPPLSFGYYYTICEWLQQIHRQFPLEELWAVGWRENPTPDPSGVGRLTNKYRVCPKSEQMRPTRPGFRRLTLRSRFRFAWFLLSCCLSSSRLSFLEVGFFFFLFCTWPLFFFFRWNFDLSDRKQEGGLQVRTDMMQTLVRLRARLWLSGLLRMFFA